MRRPVNFVELWLVANKRRRIQKGNEMLIEMRRYAIIPGQMEDMHTRMRDTLLPMFAQHGVPSPFAIWQSVPPKDTSILTWLLSWESFEQRAAVWAHFIPLFAQVRLAQGSEEFVSRADLTLINPWPDHDLAFPAEDTACEMAWHVQPCVGKGAAFRAACCARDFALFKEAGAVAIRGNEFLFGPLPKALLIVSWANATRRRAGMAKLAAQPMPADMADALGTSGNVLDSGLTESLDRAHYLSSWRHW
jgi:hypothetical protein